MNHSSEPPPKSVPVPASHLDLLERPLYGCLATVRRDGAPLVNPMWFYWDADQQVVKMTHTKTRHNFRNLVRVPRVSMAIFDPLEPRRYIQMRGIVTQIDDDPTGSFHEFLQERYQGYVTDMTDRQARVIVTVRPTGWKTAELLVLPILRGPSPTS